MKPVWCKINIFLLVFTTLFPLSVSADDLHWSKTTPQISLKHIFEGEINRSGKATGLHHISNGLKKARVKEILSGPNKYGIYTAFVEIFDPETNSWKPKFSSLFPDQYSQQDVISVIMNALSSAPQKQAGKWRGNSGKGFSIEGYRLKDMRIITAYPIYETTN